MYIKIRYKIYYFQKYFNIFKKKYVVIIFLKKIILSLLIIYRVFFINNGIKYIKITNI